MSQKRAEKLAKRKKKQNKTAKLSASNLVKKVPSYAIDDQDLFTESGFGLSNIWYHGTSSLLVDSILERGLSVSGDDEINRHVKSVMESKGLPYMPNREPIYLTPSKEVAHYWAKKTSSSRKILFGHDDKPAVLEIALTNEMNDLVKPDIGGFQRITNNKEEYLSVLQAKYKEKNLPLPQNINEANFIQKFGLAYISEPIPKEHISCISNVSEIA